MEDENAISEARNKNALERLTFTEPRLQFFAFAHLPPHLQVVSEPFGELAVHLVRSLPGNSERTKALDRLIEAKDAAVRALVFKNPEMTK